MDKEKYNGWANYATWRVALEMFDGLKSDMEDETFTADSCREYAFELIEMESQAGLARDYALEFLGDVNWQEIADNLNPEN